MRMFWILFAVRLLAVAVIAVMAAVGMAVIVLSVAVLSGAQAQTGQCIAPQDEIGGYYGVHAAAAYGYGEPAADAIVAVLTHVAGGPPPGNPAVHVLAGTDINDGSSDFFLFDANGCFTAHLGPIPFSRMVTILTAAGAQVPEFPTPVPPKQEGIGI